MTDVADKSTLSETVYSAVRTAILGGQLRPGQRLKVSDLAAEHGVSVNVVREALNRLTGEQLARAEPKIGFAVTNLSLEDLADLVAVRAAIEGTALRWAIRHGDMAWESQIVAAHYRLANTPGEPPALTDDWIRAHSDFHAQILSASGSPRMREITRSLSDSAEIYRRWSLSLAEPRRDLAREHAELVDATLARDAERAVSALTAHIEQTRNTILTNVAADAANGDGQAHKTGQRPVSRS